jgi:hypothetical protein
MNYPSNLGAPEPRLVPGEAQDKFVALFGILLD